MDEEGTGLLPGPFHSEQFYPSYILWSKMITMPFQEITKDVTVLPRPQAIPPGKQTPSWIYTFSEQWLDLGREKNGCPVCSPPQRANVMRVNHCFKLYHKKLHFQKLSSITLENAEHIYVSKHTTVLTEMILSK
jgi:hypothetical protein